MRAAGPPVLSTYPPSEDMIMRLEAQLKGGFYPCPLEAVSMVGALLRPIDVTQTNILDPCAGEGEAILCLAHCLQLSRAQVSAVELESSRAAVLAGKVPHALAGVDFLLVGCTPIQAFSMIWCNPPFDSEVGGGTRAELSFVQKATPMLVRTGVMALVVPEGTLFWQDLREHLMAWYDNLSVLPFPKGVRKYKEVVVLGVKRDRPVAVGARRWEEAIRNPPAHYYLPTSRGSKRFEKAGMSDDELAVALARSPLRGLLARGGERPMPRPPLELARGQMALVLAGGLLNTTIQKDGEPPILLKATPYKETYVSSESEELRGEGTDDETVVTVRVTSERIKLQVRVLTVDGHIHDLV